MVVGSNVCYVLGEVCLYVGNKTDSLRLINVAFSPPKYWEPQSPLPNHVTSLFIAHSFPQVVVEKCYVEEGSAQSTGGQ